MSVAITTRSRLAGRCGSIRGMRLAGTTLLLLVTVCALACAPPRVPPKGPAARPPDVTRLYLAAVEREAVDPLAVHGYLATIDAAVAEGQDAWALAALHASLDALLWRRVAVLSGGGEHAVVHRSRHGAILTSKRLRAAYAAVEPAAGAQQVYKRMILAAGLHSLALRVGNHKAAQRWSARSGCVQRATLVGPLSMNALHALTQSSPLAHDAAFAAAYPGVGPFAQRLTPEIHYADACALPLGASSPLAGLHVAVIDIDNPRAQRLYVAITSESAVRADLGGKLLLTREHALGSAAVTRFASAEAAAGKLRLVVRAARPYGRVPISVRVLDAAGEPLHADGPLAGDVAAAAANSVKALPATPAPDADHLPLAIASALSRGERRAANALAEQPDVPKPGEGSLAFDLQRMVAAEAAQDVARSARKLRLEGLSEQLLSRCPQCWEARLVAAHAAQQRAGYSTGTFEVWQRLGVTAKDDQWPQKLSLLELLWVANEARVAGQSDISRSAFDALSRRAAGSFMVADLDRRLFRRMGERGVEAACRGGLSRAGSSCVLAHLATGNVLAAQTEMMRLRRLRGDPAVMRAQELFALLTHQRRAEAMEIYQALAPGERSLALLGAWYEDAPNRQTALREVLRKNLTSAHDTPYALEPLARLLGHVPDLSFDFEKEGAKLVARDRAQAFLPGAGTAVLKRVELYDLESSGLLHYWLYDLRRVSGTTDVAGGTWFGMPMVDGRSSRNILRRRIYKKDGRILDPDPRSSGRQGQTDLSQLQAGDYVEVVAAGWGLPRENGQLVVDTADVLPRRTSLHRLDIRFRRPQGVKLAVWTHPQLGTGKSQQSDGTITTRWSLRDQPPRIIEEGVPPLEARVALSFGSDSYQRIGRAFGESLRGLSERDPYVARWVEKAVAGAKDDRERVDKLVAAVGKTIPRSDRFVLSDGSASGAVGPQGDTARTMLERGDGSRCWVIHRGLKQLGIRSTIAIAETRPFSAAPNFPARPGRFHHALVRATVDGKDLWIDADVDGPPLPPGRISPELRGRQALLPSGEMLAVTSDTKQDFDELAVTLTLLANGNASGRFTAKIHGRPAQKLSQALEDAVGEERTEMLRNVVLGWLPWADVKQVKLSASSTSWRIALEADIAVVGLAQPETRAGTRRTIAGVQPLHRFHPRAQTSSLASQYARHASRTTPLAIHAAQLYRFTRTIKLPPGSRLVRSPSSTQIRMGGLSAQRSVKSDDKHIEETFILNMPVTTIAADEYAAFAAKIREIDDNFLHSYGVELAKQP